MTAFPTHLIQSLEKYGKLQNSSDFKEICTKLCQKLISEDSLKLRESVCNQVYWDVVAGVIFEAARRGLSVAVLEELLPKNRLSEAIISTFRENEEAIRNCMTTIGWEPPQVVDIGWKLSKTLETDRGKEKKIVAEIHLDTIPTGSVTLERISFCCNFDDLQHILWKLKEAQNAVMNLKACHK